MKGKSVRNRFLSTIMAIVLIAGLLPVSGLMSTAYAAEGNYIRWGNKKYSSLNDAVEDMKDGDDVVLEVYGTISGIQKVGGKDVSLTIKSGGKESRFHDKVYFSGLKSLTLSGNGWTDLNFDDTVQVKTTDRIDFNKIGIYKEGRYEKVALAVHGANSGSMRNATIEGAVELKVCTLDQLDNVSILYKCILDRIKQTDDICAWNYINPALLLKCTEIHSLTNSSIVNKEIVDTCYGLHMTTDSRIDLIDKCLIQSEWSAIYLYYDSLIDTINDSYILGERNSLSFANQLWSRESKINNITGKTYIDGFIWHGADYGATTMIEKDLTKAFGDVQIRGYVSKASDLKKMSIPDGYEWVKDDEGVFSLRAANCYVVYHSNDAEGSMDEETIKEAKGGDRFTLKKNKFKLDGYKFKGWSEDRTGKGKIYQPGDELNFNEKTKYDIYAVWEGEPRHKVIFNSNGGSVVPFQYIRDGKTAAKPDDPTLISGTFDGWYTDNELTKEYDFKKPVTEDMTLYAKWKTNKLTATLDVIMYQQDLMEDYDAELEPVQFDYGTVPELPIDPGVPGYWIKRWFLTPYGFPEYGNEPFTEDTTLYGYLEDRIYEVTVDPGGGRYTRSSSWYTDKRTFYYDYLDQLDISADWVTGSTFVGYYADPDYRQKIDLPDRVTSDMTIYLKWKPTEYTVKFYDDDKETLIHEAEVPYRELAVYTPQKPHKKFVTWQYQRYSSDKELSDWDMNTMLVQKDRTLYAKWEDDETAHGWGEWEVIKKPKKGKPGLEERKCVYCGATETRELIDEETQEMIEEPDAGLLEYVDMVQPTCTEDGARAYWILKGDSEESTHYYADAEGNEELNKEELRTPALGHTYELVEEDPDAPEDDYETAVRSKYPTCTEEGWLVFRCTTCGEVYKTEPEKMSENGQHGAKTGLDPEHPDEPYAVDIEATCTENGGHYEFWFCSVCGELIDLTVEETEAYGHDWGEPVYEWAEDNSTVMASVTCSRCGETETEIVETISEVTKEPTADKPGEMTYIAEFDNDKFTRQEKIVEIEPPGEEEEVGPPDEEAIGIGE